MFVVAGEALMDVFTGAATPTGIAMDARIGGSPLNVAMGLARLGQPVAFLGGLSSGALGQRLEEALRSEGVSLQCVHRSAAPTTLGLVGLDAHGVADYAFYGEGAADRTLPLAALEHLPPAASAIHVGSYTMVVGETARTQRALVEQSRGRRLVSYDPNLRLNVEPDIEVWRDTLAWMLPRTDVLKLSDEDLGLLHPGADRDALAGRWLAEGAGLVALTRGGAGAIAWRLRPGSATEMERFEVEPVKVAVVDTVGAGDTFQAALLARLAELEAATPAGVRALASEKVRDVLGFATRAAAITCSRRGADLPRRGELQPERAG
jgi:fructokinase